MPTNSPKSRQAPLDLLRLNSAAHRKLVDALDRRSANTGLTNKRHEKRFQYMMAEGLGITIVLSHANRLNCIVRPRNISRTGIGFFHGQFVHNGTPCIVGLKQLDDQIIPTLGTVRFCRHIFGHVHEVGVGFSEPIDVLRFAADPELAEMAERQARQRFVGHVVVVDPEPADRSLVKFHVTELGAQASDADDAPEGLDLICSARPDLVMCSLDLPSMPGLELIQSLREEGLTMPVAVWSPTADREALDAAREAGVAVLSAPLEVEPLVAFLEKTLPAAGSNEASTPKTPLGVHQEISS